jgi:hypothetical protein
VSGGGSRAKPSRQGTGAPTFCWVCNHQLKRAPGRGKGLFYFELVRDPSGAVHRVHGQQCLRAAIEDGNRLVNDGHPSPTEAAQ